MPDDYAAMRRALRLAACGRHASPNPMVGCVILGADGRKVGEGFHREPGGPHAEAVALDMAGERARGGTVYVTLEPCSHHGRTPPCADRLIAAGVRRAVAAVEDPDARVRGTGLARLADAGIEVTVGICEAQARALNAAFFKHRITSLPYVTIKMAMTLDGRIATRTGDSKWITSAVTRAWVHRQRDRADAVLVGVGTVLADDPSLTTRLIGRVGRSPLRIIVDTQLRTPPGAKVLGPADGRTLIACSALADPARRSALEAAGAEIIALPVTDRGRVDLRALMAELGTNRGIQSVLVEGGGELVAALLADCLADKYVATIGPKLIGGRDAPGPVGGEGLAGTMSHGVAVKEWTVRRSGPDIVITGAIERGMV